jgi:hypothetical protein
MAGFLFVFFSLCALPLFVVLSGSRQVEREREMREEGEGETKRGERERERERERAAR